MAIKTGCSASLAALHEAVRAIQNGDATAAVVAGTSLIMTPALTSAMTALELLSPKGRAKLLMLLRMGSLELKPSVQCISKILTPRFVTAMSSGLLYEALLRTVTEEARVWLLRMELPRRLSFAKLMQIVAWILLTQHLLRYGTPPGPLFGT